jgi:ABC-type multidrug transport system ATPase subunit
MSERILKALMQLFSLVADADDVTGRSRKIVESFLRQQLSQSLVDDYLRLFDEFLEKKDKKRDGSKRQKRTAVNSVKVLLICTQINEELAQKQKIVVLIRLLEFIYAGETTTDQEFEFVQTVAETFNISTDEFKLIHHFVTSNITTPVTSQDILVIDSLLYPKYPNAKHLHTDGLEGEIRVLQVESVNMYFVRNMGNDELYINGFPFGNDRTYILNSGSSIRSQKVAPIYYSDILGKFLSDEHSEKIVFNVDNITYKFKTGNIGLHPLTFSEESGHLVGIMGASGAGKSTLLNILNGTYTPTTGKVSINSIDIYKHKEKIEGIIGYVSQDDLLIEELTVYQNLFYNAKLCFGQLDEKQIHKKVIAVLQSIGLYDAKDLKVGTPLEKTISGGQRKRLNIALELIREPSVLFVDEPTSGLSSRDSENIMDLLKELALKGKLVFVVIHQPSSDIFKMFDNLLILDTGGYPIYIGNPVDAVIYFKSAVNHVNSDEAECPRCGNVNPEQIFNIIEAKVVDEYGNLTKTRKFKPEDWYNRYKELIEPKLKILDDREPLPKNSFNIPNKLKQFKVFITRDVLSKLANKQYMYINMLEAPVLAFILAYIIRYYNTDVSNTLGYVYRENENIPAYLFMGVIVALFIGLTVSAEEIIRDRKILKREKFLNLSKGSYLFSKIAIMLVLSAVQTITFILVGNFVLDIKGMYATYWLVLFSTSFFANMLGLNISASFNSAVTIYILIPFLIIPQLILSGVIVKFDKLNPSLTSQTTVPLSGDVMTSRWAFEALAVTQFKDNEFEKHFYNFDKQLKIAEYKKNFWLSKLREKLSFIKNNINKHDKKQELVNAFSLLKNEIGKENKKLQNITFDKLDELSFETYKINETDKKLNQYFNKLNRYYLDMYHEASDNKDALISKMNKTDEDRQKFIALKDNYTNESLNDLVQNKNELNKIIEVDNQLIQKADPVFLDSDSFRSHFFAPRKKLFGKSLPTYWVNILVIWMMSIILGITLYFDVLKKLISGLEHTFGKK